jgi:stage III sporulation protein SpoIIIAA
MAAMAQEMIAQARTVEELRQAQTVALPLLFGLSLAQTATAIGRSRVWTCRLRNRFLAGQICGDGRRQRRGGRRRQIMSPEQEREVLEPSLERARSGGTLVVPQIKREREARLRRTLALSSVYNVLHRHGWRWTNVIRKATRRRRRSGKNPDTLADIDREWVGTGLRWPPAIPSGAS